MFTTEFNNAYFPYVKPNEGFYSNISGDKGGQTYAGISRVNWPKWGGWPIVDAYISKNGEPKNNTKIPGLDDLVTAFYFDLFNTNNFDKIKNANIRNIIFDWFVNSGGNAAGTTGKETFGVDEILNRDFGYRLPIDKKFDMATINAINSVSAPNALYNTILKERKVYYEKLAQTPGQEKFLKSWLGRLSKFTPLEIAVGSGAIIAVIAVFVFIIILSK